MSARCIVELWVHSSVIFKGVAETTLQDPAFGEWFDSYSGLRDSRLVRSAAGASDWRESREAFQRSLSLESSAPRPVLLDDGGTLLLATTGTLDYLNREMAASGLEELSMDRFR